MLFLYQTNNFN